MGYCDNLVQHDNDDFYNRHYFNSHYENEWNQVENNEIIARALLKEFSQLEIVEFSKYLQAEENYFNWIYIYIWNFLWYWLPNHVYITPNDLDIPLNESRKKKIWWSFESKN